jgi:hypothetical protein
MVPSVPENVAPVLRRRAIFAVLAFALAGFMALAVGVGPVQAASSLTLNKHSGLAMAQPLQVSYLSDKTGSGTCGAGAIFTWDGAQLGVHLGGTLSGGRCLYQSTFYIPVTGHAAPGPHTIVARQCTSTVPLVCDRTTSASATFTIDAPTITLTPTSGLPGHSFTAVMTMPAAYCATVSSVQFHWDTIGGTLLGRRRGTLRPVRRRSPAYSRRPARPTGRTWSRG